MESYLGIMYQLKVSAHRLRSRCYKMKIDFYHKKYNNNDSLMIISERDPNIPLRSLREPWDKNDIDDELEIIGSSHLRNLNADSFSCLNDNVQEEVYTSVMPVWKQLSLIAKERKSLIQPRLAESFEPLQERLVDKDIKGESQTVESGQYTSYCEIDNVQKDVNIPLWKRCALDAKERKSQIQPRLVRSFEPLQERLVNKDIKDESQTVESGQYTSYCEIDNVQKDVIIPLWKRCALDAKERKSLIQPKLVESFEPLQVNETEKAELPVVAEKEKDQDQQQSTLDSSSFNTAFKSPKCTRCDCQAQEELQMVCDVSPDVSSLINDDDKQGNAADFLRATPTELVYNEAAVDIASNEAAITYRDVNPNSFRKRFGLDVIPGHRVSYSSIASKSYGGFITPDVNNDDMLKDTDSPWLGSFIDDEARKKVVGLTLAALEKEKCKKIVERREATTKYITVEQSDAYKHGHFKNNDPVHPHPHISRIVTSTKATLASLKTYRF